MTTQVKSN